MPVMEQKPLAISGAISRERGSANAHRLAIDSVKKSLSEAVGSSAENEAENEKVCWIEVKQYLYQPDHQVELLHLQAEADALLIKLQAREQVREQKQLSEKAAL